MNSIKKSILFKIISIVIIIAFINLDISWAYPELTADRTNLGGQSIFQPAMMTHEAVKYQGTIFSDAKLLSSVYAIGEYLLSSVASTGEQVPLEYFEHVLRNEVPGEFLEGIALEHVVPIERLRQENPERLKEALEALGLEDLDTDEDIIIIPYKDSKGKKHLIQIALKSEVSPEKLAGYELPPAFDKYLVKDLPIDYSETSQAESKPEDVEEKEDLGGDSTGPVAGPGTGAGRPIEQKSKDIRRSDEQLTKDNTVIIDAGQGFQDIDSSLGLTERLDLVIEAQESNEDFKLPPFLADGTSYWSGHKSAKLTSGNERTFYKIFNKGRDQAFRDDPPSLARPECPLCISCRQAVDKGILLDDGKWEAKANLFPIFGQGGNHGIIISQDHREQALNKGDIEDVLRWSAEAKEYKFFYNGKDAGATIPTHRHIQFFKSLKPFNKIGEQSPLEKAIDAEKNLSAPSTENGVTTRYLRGYPTEEKAITVLILECTKENNANMAVKTIEIINEMESEGRDYNIMWMADGDKVKTIIIPRSNKQVGLETDADTKTVKTEKDHLLGMDSKADNKRVKSRVFAMIEFLGIFVGVDKEQYGKVTHEDLVEILYKLGMPYQPTKDIFPQKGKKAKVTELREKNKGSAGNTILPFVITLLVMITTLLFTACEKSSSSGHEIQYAADGIPELYKGSSADLSGDGHVVVQVTPGAHVVVEVGIKNRQGQNVYSSKRTPDENGVIVFTPSTDPHPKVNEFTDFSGVVAIVVKVWEGNTEDIETFYAVGNTGLSYFQAPKGMTWGQLAAMAAAGRESLGMVHDAKGEKIQLTGKAGISAISILPAVFGISALAVIGVLNINAMLAVVAVGITAALMTALAVKAVRKTKELVHVITAVIMVIPSLLFFTSCTPGLGETEEVNPYIEVIGSDQFVIEWGREHSEVNASWRGNMSNYVIQVVFNEGKSANVQIGIKNSYNDSIYSYPKTPEPGGSVTFDPINEGRRISEFGDLSTVHLITIGTRYEDPRPTYEELLDMIQEIRLIRKQDTLDSQVSYFEASKGMTWGQLAAMAAAGTGSLGMVYQGKGKKGQPTPGEPRDIMDVSEDELLTLVKNPLNRQHVDRLLENFDILWWQGREQTEEAIHFEEVAKRLLIAQAVDGSYGTPAMLDKPDEFPLRVLEQNGITVDKVSDIGLLLYDDVFRKKDLTLQKIQSSGLDEERQHLLKEMYVYFCIADSMDMGADYLKQVEVRVENGQKPRSFETPKKAYEFQKGEFSKHWGKNVDIGRGEFIASYALKVLARTATVSGEEEDDSDPAVKLMRIAKSAWKPTNLFSAQDQVGPVAMTGATGFVGSNLVELLQETETSITALSREASPHMERLPESNRIGITDSDLLNPDYETFNNAMQTNRVFYHLGAMSNHTECSEQPEKALAINSLTTAILAKLAEKNGTRFIFSSTFYVYSLLRKPVGELIKEEDAAMILPGDEPEIQALREWLDETERSLDAYAEEFVDNEGQVAVSPEKFISLSINIPEISEERLKELGLPSDYFYPLTKALAERFVKKIDTGMVVRFSNMYGPKQDEVYKVPTYILTGYGKGEDHVPGILHLKPGDTFEVWAKGARDYLYIADCVKALGEAARVPLTEDTKVINIASGVATTNINIGKAITEGVGNDVTIVKAEKEDKSVHICDNTKFKKYLHPEAMTPLKEGIKKTIEYYSKKNDSSKPADTTGVGAAHVDDPAFKTSLEDQMNPELLFELVEEMINSRRAEVELAGNGVAEFLAERNELPEEVDLLLVLGSPDLDVARGAAELYKSGKTKFKYVMTSGKGQGDLPEAEIFKREMIKHGVPEEAFLEPETESRFMGENLSLSAKKLEESGKLSEIKSVVVVQTPLYNCQAKAAFGKNFVTEEGKVATQEAYVYAPYLPAKIDRTKSTQEMKRQLEEVLAAADNLDSFAEKGGIDKVDIPEEVKEAVRKIKENLVQIEADSVVATIITLARKAARQDQQLIIGLETDWIPGYKEKDLRRDAINPLISMIESLGDEFRKMGLDNIILVPGSGDALAADLLNKANETSTDFSNVVVMASKDTISSNKFNPLRSTQDVKGAFLASIDPSEILEAYKANNGKIPRYFVIKMMLMLSLTLELAAGKTVPILPKKFPIEMTYNEKLRTVMYKLKPIEPIEYGLMLEEHKNELKALTAL